MDSKRHIRIFTIISIIYLIALALRILIIRFACWNDPIYYESAEIARYIVAGKGYWWNWYGAIPPQPTAILPPLYTYFTAFFMACLQNPAKAFYIAQAIINSLGVIPSFYLGRQFCDNKTGIVSASLYAVFPEIAYTSAKPAAESLLMPFIVLILFMFLKAKEKLARYGNAGQFFWVGIIIGIAALIKTTAAFIVPAGCASLILLGNYRKKAIIAGFLLGLGFLAAISPWSIRNTLVLGKPVLLNTMYGFNLWRGNHPGASGTGRLDKNRLSEADLDPEYKKYIELNHPNTEVGIDKFYLDEAMKFIKADPGRYARLTLKRIFYFLVFDPTHPLTTNVVYIGGYIFAVIFGIWGAIILGKTGKFDSIFIFTPIVFLIFYAPVIILPRYRLTVVLMLVSLSGVSLTKLLSKAKFLGKYLPQ